MLTAVLAKFNVTSITKTRYFGKDVCSVKLQPVYNDSPENKQFWDATPSGSIEINILRPDVAQFFEINLGKAVYVQFLEATATE